MKLFALIPAILLLSAAPQQEGKDFVTNEEFGFRIAKPPKAEEWEVKGKDAQAKRYSNSAAEVSCRVNDVAVAVFGQLGEQGREWPELEKIATDTIENLKKDQAVQQVDTKVNRDDKFPGRKAEKARYLEVQLELKDGKKIMQRYWLFISGKNRNLFTVLIVGDEAVLKDPKKRYGRDVQVVLSTFESLAVKKKK